MPTVKATLIPFDLNGREVLLIDDVIFTGRTVRAALDAMFSQGRPDRVDFAVLVDRGHREFPIRPDWIGLNLSTQRHQAVNVFLFDDPVKDHVILEDRKYQILNGS
jgi:pyrimidine operon attenuation protein/uracil phosphoribosyltransferase